MTLKFEQKKQRQITPKFGIQPKMLENFIQVCNYSKFGQNCHNISKFNQKYFGGKHPIRNLQWTKYFFFFNSPKICNPIKNIQKMPRKLWIEPKRLLSKHLSQKKFPKSLWFSQKTSSRLHFKWKSGIFMILLWRLLTASELDRDIGVRCRKCRYQPLLHSHSKKL